ncbi:MAG: HEPN domain-containing protein [bacterium]
MRNADEPRRWLKDARACLETARRDFKAKDFRATVQNGQLAVELSAKALIACFSEPEWVHDPSGQLLSVAEIYKSKIEKVFGVGIVEELKLLAKGVKEISPWHGFSIYGRRTREGWVSAVDICTAEKADWALQSAERSFRTASNFVDRWFEGESQRRS